MKVDMIFASAFNYNTKLPFYESKVQAGFPSPAEDRTEATLDLNEHLIRNPEATFYVRVTGDSMMDAGIKENDLLVVDRSVEPAHNKIVIANIDGEFTVKRLKIINKEWFLVAENKNYPSMKLNKNASILGVVTAVVHQF